MNEVLNVPAYQEKLASAPNVQLVDVRTPEEYQEGHIEGAANIDFLDPLVFEEEFAKLDRNKPLMIYCRSGGRSAEAAEKLEAMGFKEIYDLEGGYLQWPKE